MKAGRVIVLLLTLAGMGVTAWLGGWQLSRAAEKQALQEAWLAAGRQPDAGGELLHADGAATSDVLYRHVQLHGRWLAQHTVYLDNRSMDRRTGFYVLTPLQLASGQGTVLVLRGWAPRDFLERSRLPALETPIGPVALRGQVILRVPGVYALGADGNGPIRQNLDTTAFGHELGLSLYDGVIQQVGPASEGLLRHWPEPASGLERHRGYAFQWFGLCALMGVLFVWNQIVRTRHANPRRKAGA